MNIEDITKEAGKTYGFRVHADSKKPAQFWFQDTRDGLTLFIVFYTLGCRWSKCLGCNLPSLVSKEHVPYSHIMAQVDHLFNHILTDQQKTGLKKIILSNNGSVLDEDTFSTTALIYFVAMMNLHCPGISILCMETRPEYIDWEELELISRALKEGATGTDLEIAIGFEAYSDVIRNEYFHKGMSLEVFEEMVEKLGKYGFRLKTYFMQKPVPGITEEEGRDDIIDAIDYLDSIAQRYSIDINLHLNPTYVAAGTELERAFIEKRYTPPLLKSVRDAVLHAENRNLSVYIGLSDEGLAVKGGSFIRPGDEEILEVLEKFNRTGNFRYLKGGPFS